jgi:hypothetical protein
MSGRVDRWIRWTTTGCAGLLEPIAAAVSNLHMHLLAGLARAAGVGGGSGAVLGGRDDGDGVDDAAGRQLSPARHENERRLLTE